MAGSRPLGPDPKSSLTFVPPSHWPSPGTLGNLAKSIWLPRSPWNCPRRFGDPDKVLFFLGLQEIGAEKLGTEQRIHSLCPKSRVSCRPPERGRATAQSEAAPSHGHRSHPLRGGRWPCSPCSHLGLSQKWGQVREGACYTDE